MEVIVWLLERFLQTIYAALGSVLGLLIVIPSILTMVDELGQGIDQLLGRVSDELSVDALLVTYRPSDMLHRFADWAEWVWLGEVAQNIGQWVGAPHRELVISSLAVLGIFAAIGTYFSLWAYKDTRTWKPLAAGWISTAALAELGYPVWPVMVGLFGVYVAMRLIWSVAVSRLELPSSPATFIDNLTFDLLAALLAGPVLVFTGAYL